MPTTADLATLGRSRHPHRQPLGRRSAAVVAVVLLGPMMGVTVAASTASGATGLTVSRVSGADRYATAAAIADSGWPSALPANSTLLLATGSTFHDAVSGSAAAGHLG